jgi:hypothetical protein
MTMPKVVHTSYRIADPVMSKGLFQMSASLFRRGPEEVGYLLPTKVFSTSGLV